MELKQDLQVEYLPYSEIKKYSRNARTHSDEQIDQLVNSMREFGWTQPVLIDENNVLIAGHGRFEAGNILEIEIIPCIRLVGLTESQKKAYRIADNRLPQNAGWDYALLSAEVQDLLDSDFDCDLLGFNDEEMDKLLNGVDEPEDDNSSGPLLQVASVRYLTIDKHRVPARDDEIERLLTCYQQYVDTHGSHEGFVGSLTEGR